MGTTIMLSQMLTGFVFALFIVDSEATNCHECKCCDPNNRGAPSYYMNWWPRRTPQFGPQLPQYGNFGPQLPQYGNYGPQLPQYGNYGGWWGGHGRPWNNILMGK